MLEIDDPVFAEAGDWNTALRIEGDETIAGRDVQNPFFASVGPVREPAARELPGRRRAARAFTLAMHPHHLAGRGIERHHGSTRAAHPGRTAAPSVAF